MPRLDTAGRAQLVRDSADRATGKGRRTFYTEVESDEDVAAVIDAVEAGGWRLEHMTPARVDRVALLFRR